MRALKLHSIHRAENERSEANARDLTRMLEKSGEAGIVKDPNAAVPYWNREAACFFLESVYRLNCAAFRTPPTALGRGSARSFCSLLDYLVRRPITIYAPRRHIAAQYEQAG
jgi:hypothetical protein